MLTLSLTGWPLVWKTWKCQEFETRQGNVRDVVNSQGNVREKILSWKSVPKLLVTRGILAFPSKTVHSYIYTVISSFVVINYEIIVNLIVWSFILKLVLQACYEYHLTWAWVPPIVREMSGNFRVSGEWSPWINYFSPVLIAVPVHTWFVLHVVINWHPRVGLGVTGVE